MNGDLMLTGIRKHALEDPHREVCGFLVKDGDGVRVVRARNVHETPTAEYRTDPDTANSVLEDETVVGIYHSHPSGPADLSDADRGCMELFGWPMWIYSVEDDDLREHQPPPQPMRVNGEAAPSKGGVGFRTIRLGWWLGKEFGREFRVTRESTRNFYCVLEFLVTQIPGFRKLVQEKEAEGHRFAVRVGDRIIDQTEIELLAPIGDDDVMVFPVPTGSIVGSLISLAVGLVVSLAAALIQRALLPGPAQTPREEEGFGFGRLSNANPVGDPVPVLYGLGLISAQRVSTSIRSTGFVDEDGDGISNDQVLKVVHMVGEGPIEGPVPLPRALVKFGPDSRQPGEGGGAKITKLNMATLISGVEAPQYGELLQEFRPGTNDQDIIPGFGNVENVIFVREGMNQDVGIVVGPLGDIGGETLESFTVNVSIEVNFYADNNPDPITLSADILLTENGTNEELTSKLVYTGFINGTHTYSKRIEIPRERMSGDQGYTLTVTKTSRDSDLKWQQLASVHSVTETYTDSYSYPNTSVVATEIRASATEDVDEVQFLMAGKLVRVPSNYDPVGRVVGGPGAQIDSQIWDGTWRNDPADPHHEWQPGDPIDDTSQWTGPSLVWTNAPIWCTLDMATNQRFGLGDWMDYDHFPLFGLYEKQKRCDERVTLSTGGEEFRHSLNIQIEKSAKAWSLMSDLASNFLAAPNWAGAFLDFDMERPLGEPVYTFNPTNVVGGIFERTSPKLNESFNVVNIRYWDPSEDYENSVVVLRNAPFAQRFGPRAKAITAPGVASNAEATRWGTNFLISEAIEERIGFRVGPEGERFSVGALVAIFDPFQEVDVSTGRLQPGTTATELHLDQDVIVDSANSKVFVNLSDVVDTLVEPDNSVEIGPLSAIPDAGLEYVEVLMEDPLNPGTYVRRQPNDLREDTGDWYLGLTPFAGSGQSTTYIVEYAQGVFESAVVDPGDPAPRSIITLQSPMPNVPAEFAVFNYVLPTFSEIERVKVISVEQVEGSFIDYAVVPYSDEKFAQIDTGIIVEPPDSSVLPPTPSREAPPPPRALDLAIEVRLTGDNRQQLALVARWQPPAAGTPGIENIVGYQISYRRGLETVTDAGWVPGNQWILDGIEYGLWSVTVYSRTAGGVLSSTPLTRSIIYDETTVPTIAARVTGLEIGEGGNSEEFETAGVQLQWRTNSPSFAPVWDDREKLSGGYRDPLFKVYAIQVQHLNSGAVFDKYTTEVERFEYTHDMNLADARDALLNQRLGEGAASRELLFWVRIRDTLDREGPGAFKRATNPPPPFLPTLDLDSSNPDFLVVSVQTGQVLTLPADFRWHLAWLHIVTGGETDFDETQVDPVRINDFPTSISTKADTDYLIKFATADVFSMDDPETLNVSLPYAFRSGLVDPGTLSSGAIVAGRIITVGEGSQVEIRTDQGDTNDEGAIIVNDNAAQERARLGALGSSQFGLEVYDDTGALMWGLNSGASTLGIEEFATLVPYFDALTGNTDLQPGIYYVFCQISDVEVRTDWDVHITAFMNLLRVDVRNRHEFQYRVKRDTVVIYTSPVYTYPAVGQPLADNAHIHLPKHIFETPGNGTFTYSIEIQQLVGASVWQATECSMQILVRKR